MRTLDINSLIKSNWKFEGRHEIKKEVGQFIGYKQYTFNYLHIYKDENDIEKYIEEIVMLPSDHNKQKETVAMFEIIKGREADKILNSLNIEDKSIKEIESISWILKNKELFIGQKVKLGEEFEIKEEFFEDLINFDKLLRNKRGLYKQFMLGTTEENQIPYYNKIMGQCRQYKANEQDFQRYFKEFGIKHMASKYVEAIYLLFKIADRYIVDNYKTLNK